MDLMAVTDNIVDPIFFERLGNFRQFLELSLSEIFNRKVKIFPQVEAPGQLARPAAQLGRLRPADRDKVRRALDAAGAAQLAAN